MVLFCSPLSTRLVPGPRVQGQQPPQEPAPASCACVGPVSSSVCVSFRSRSQGGSYGYRSSGGSYRDSYDSYGKSGSKEATRAVRGWAWPAPCPQSSLGHSARAQLPTAAQDRGPGAWDLGHPRACGELSSIQCLDTVALLSSATHNE